MRPLRTGRAIDAIHAIDAVAAIDTVTSISAGVTLITLRTLRADGANGDLPEEMDGADIGWSLGIKRAIGGHWFEVLLTNNQGTLTDQYVSSTFQGSGFDADDVKLGFNIERRFGRRRR